VLHPKARPIAEKLLRLAQDLNDSTALLKGHLVMSVSLFLEGELLAARGHLEQCIGLYETELHHKSTVLTTGIDPGVTAQCYAGMTHWLLGYPAQALASSTAAMTLAEELAHPHSSAMALIYAARVHGWGGELQEAREHAEAGARLSHEQGFTATWVMGTIVHSAALAGRGHSENQVREASDALAILRDSRQKSFMPYFLVTIAEIHGKAGQVDEALSVLGEAIEMSTNRGERYNEPELHRLKGEFTLQACGGHPASAVQQEAEACFEKALDIAREQSAKSWELRAATSLARLWQQQGKQAEAHELLSEIYNWFTEGFDTADLKDAKALLEELE
jgi:predicted ATPase